MKIAIFTETYLPYINGVVTHIKILREGLIKMGHQVVIVTADTKKGGHTYKDGIFRCPAIELKKLYGYGLASPVSPALEKFIKKFEPDIIHVETEFGIGLEGIRCSRKFNIPLVYTLHTLYDYYVYYIAPKPLTGVATKLSHKYIRAIAKRADIITGPSQKCADYLHNAGLKRKVYVLPNPVETDMFRKDAVTDFEKAELRKALGIPEEAFLGCFCGRLGKEKMVPELLKIYASCVPDDTYLLIMGGGPEREALEDMSSSLGLSNRVIFTGAVPHEKLPPYYAISDFYATASVSDTYSISMLEAQASGLYVLQKKDDKNAFQTKAGINGESFSDGNEFNAIVEKLKHMPEDEKEKLENETRKSVEIRSSQAIAKSMSELYSLAIERRKKGIKPRGLKEKI